MKKIRKVVSKMKGIPFIAKPVETGFTIIIYKNQKRSSYIGMNEGEQKNLKDITLFTNKKVALDRVKKYREQGVVAKLYSVVRDRDGNYENINPVTDNKILESI